MAHAEAENFKRRRPAQQSVPEFLKQLCGIYQDKFLQTLLPDLVANFFDIKDFRVKNKAILEVLETMQSNDVHELMLCIQIIAHRQGMNYMCKLAHSDAMNYPNLLYFGADHK